MLPIIRIALIDDHGVVRAGYRRLLENEAGYKVVIDAGSAREALPLIKRMQPDVVILDLSLPGEDGLAVLRQLRAQSPRIAVVVSTMHDSLGFAMQSIQAGACGYVTKSSDPQVLVAAVRAATARTLALSPDVAAKMINLTRSAAFERTFGLTGRELDIFRLVAGGRTANQIGRALNISVKTVKNCRSIVRQKLGVSNDVELLQIAMGCAAGTAPLETPSD